MYLSILSILALIVGVIGIFLAVIFYLKSKKVKKLIYMFETTEIISKRKTIPEDIEILYKNKKVDRVSKTILIMWNNGRETIDSKDVVNSKPIEIVFPADIKILRSEILKTYRKDIINFKTKFISDCKIQIDFNFLDHKDGALIEIIHTGNKSTKFNINGVIKGAPNGIKNKGDFSAQKESMITFRLLTISLIFIFLTLYSPIFESYLRIFSKLIRYLIELSILTLAILLIYIIDRFALRFIKNYPKKLKP